MRYFKLKKGDIAWDVIGKIILILIAFVAILAVVLIMMGKGSNIIDTIAKFFGG